MALNCNAKVNSVSPSWDDGVFSRNLPPKEVSLCYGPLG